MSDHYQMLSPARSEENCAAIALAQASPTSSEIAAARAMALCSVFANTLNRAPYQAYLRHCLQLTVIPSVNLWVLPSLAAAPIW